MRHHDHLWIRIPDQGRHQSRLRPVAERKALPLLPFCLTEHLKDDEFLVATCKENAVGRALSGLLDTGP